MKTLLNRAMAILAKRDHSEYELRRKLAAQPVLNRYQKQPRSTLSQDPTETLSPAEREEQINLVIEYCYTHHWLDERKFSENFIRSRAIKGYGLQRIQSELQQKGIDKDIIYSVLTDCEIDWVELAHKLMIKQFGSKPITDWKSKAKVYNYLMYRGFSQDEISEAFKMTQE